MNQPTPEPKPPRPYGRWLLIGHCTLVLVYLIFPIFVIVPISFSSAKYLTFPPPGFSLQWWTDYLSRRDWTSSTLLSFQVATLTTLLATAHGTAASFTLVRVRFRAKTLVYSLILSPMIVPPIITAIALYFFFSQLRVIGNWMTLVLGHTVIAIPLVVVLVSAALKGFDETLEHAAMSLGAGRLRTFTRVTFPLIRPGILTAALFAFLSSFDELLIAIFLSGTRAVTLPKRMWDGVRFEINPTISVVATILITLSLAVLLGVEMIRRRGQRRLKP